MVKWIATGLKKTNRTSRKSLMAQLKSISRKRKHESPSTSDSDTSSSDTSEDLTKRKKRKTSKAKSASKKRTKKQLKSNLVQVHPPHHLKSYQNQNEKTKNRPTKKKNKKAKQKRKISSYINGNINRRQFLIRKFHERHTSEEN